MSLNQFSEQQQEQVFWMIEKLNGNEFCADCESRGATWTSQGFGVLICIHCSGVHRSFGFKITQVKSSKLDRWTHQEFRIVEMIGNQAANGYWEWGLSQEEKKKILSQLSRQEFLQRKYIQKFWVNPGLKNPVELLKEKHYKITKQELY